MNIVLVEPAIPQNTGNIGRLAAATNSYLHLIKPFGFTIDDKKLKRAGLDYWDNIKISIHENWECFLEATCPSEDTLWFLSTKGSSSIYETRFKEDDYLVFGNEVAGLAASFHERYAKRMRTIPINTEHVRSLNLSNSVAVAVYEAMRQLDFSNIV